MLDDEARRTHATADSVPAVSALLRGLRQALTDASPTVEVPVVLARQEGLHLRAGAVRQHVMRELRQLTTEGVVRRDEAEALTARFALDGILRDGRAIHDRFGIGRETMRTRYGAAMEALSDRLAGMPLTVRPAVTLSEAQRELVVASVLSSEPATDGSDRVFLQYVHQRVRHRILGDEQPGPPRQDRVVDRRWQRAADRLGALVEDRLDRGLAVDVLEPASSRELEQLRAWVKGGRPLEQAGPELSLAFMRAVLHKQTPEMGFLGQTRHDDTLEDAAREFEAAFFDLALPWQLAVLVTARGQAKGTKDWATAGLLHFHMARSLAERSFPAAAEHMMRAGTGPVKQVLERKPPETAFVFRMYRVNRFHSRVNLYLGRGPTSLHDLRATLQSFADYSASLSRPLDFAEGVRLYHALLNAELAAALAGADPEEGRRVFAEIGRRITHQSAEPLDSEIDRALRRARGDLRALWRGDSSADRRAIAARLATRLSGPSIESKIGSSLAIRRWTNPQ